MNYDVNESTKIVVPKAGVQQHPAGNCRHVNVHHKGSSARYRRTMCKDCKEMWQEERETGTEDPEQCRHLHTDHRGSTKLIRRTFCKDCSTYIDAISKELDNELEYTVVPS